MKTTIFSVLVVIVAVITGSIDQKCNTRNHSYEHYCDSIWENDPDYYMDVLMESDEYINYIEQNGQWWNN